MNRRTFTKLSTGGVGLATFPWVWTTRKSAVAGVLLKNGLVYDGLGSAPIQADIALEADRILEIGPDLSAGSADTIDVTGMAVAPGFIDVHSHTDLSLLVNPKAESKIRQGVTTEVVGQDGSSIGPWSDDAFAPTRDLYRHQYSVILDFRHLNEFFARLEIERPSVNLASMIGAGTVREFVIGYEERPATEDELDQMVELVRAGLDAGACGVSSGLEYIPGAFADTAELIRLVEPLAGTGLCYATHMRNEDDDVISAVEEAIHIGRMAGVPVNLSHLKAIGQRNWWKPDIILAMVESASASGQTVTFDRYPYVAYNTTLASLFPVWSREGGNDEFFARLADPAMDGAIRSAVREKIERLGDWDAVKVTATASDSLSWANGRHIGELASERGEDPYETTRYIILNDGNRTGMVGFGMGEENTERFLQHPAGMICSDAGARAPYGLLSRGSPHPRAYGSYPRVLGHYCRDRGLMPLEEAIRKMTSMPADLIGMPQRGRIAEGAFADLVVFDPTTVNDRATFEEPHQYPEGIEFVFVNGESVIARGEHTDRRPGRPLRPSTTSP